MGKLSDTVQYVSIYFIAGYAPEGWGRNDIHDPPSGGWSNAFIIKQNGFLPKIFVPYTVQSWSVKPDCYELSRYRDPPKPVDPVWMKDCIERNFTSRQGLGIAMDKEAAGQVIVALGFELPDMFKDEVIEATPKERKAREPSAKKEARAGLISVASIAEELKIEPRIARGYLRGAKVDKPEAGWVGDASWAAEIKAILQAEMSKEKPVKVKATPKPEVVKPVPKAKPAKKVVKVIAKVKKPTPKKKPAKKVAPKKKGKKA